jgi:hypothetical protein
LLTRFWGACPGGVGTASHLNTFISTGFIYFELFTLPEYASTGRMDERTGVSFIVVVTLVESTRISRSPGKFEIG